MTSTLDQAKQLIDRLPPLDQARLLAHLVARIEAWPPAEDADSPPTTGDPWAHLFATLDTIAAGPWTSDQTGNDELSAMRR